MQKEEREAGRRAQSANLSERFSFDNHFCDLLELSSQCDDSAERFPAQFFFAELQCIENNILPGILEPCDRRVVLLTFPGVSFGWDYAWSVASTLLLSASSRFSPFSNYRTDDRSAARLCPLAGLATRASYSSLRRIDDWSFCRLDFGQLSARLVSWPLVCWRTGRHHPVCHVCQSLVDHRPSFRMERRFLFRANVPLQSCVARICHASPHRFFLAIGTRNLRLHRRSAHRSLVLRPGRPLSNHFSPIAQLTLPPRTKLVRRQDN